MKQIVSFDKLKLTNNLLDDNGHVSDPPPQATTASPPLQALRSPCTPEAELGQLGVWMRDRLQRAALLVRGSQGLVDLRPGRGFLIFCGRFLTGKDGAGCGGRCRRLFGIPAGDGSRSSS